MKILQLHAAAIAILGLVVAGFIYALWRPHGVPRLLGPQRWPAVPWMLPEVLLAIALMLILVDILLGSSGFLRGKLDPAAYEGVQIASTYALVVGPFDAGMSSGLASFITSLTAHPPEMARRVSEARALMFANVIISPFLVYGVVVMMRRLVNASPYQMGLHLNRWKENVTLGCIGWALTTPLVVLIYVFVRLEFWETLWGRQIEHPASQLLSLSPTAWTWILVTLSTCVIAPLKEEVLLRGIVQPYLIRWPITSDALILLSVSWAILNLFTPGPSPSSGSGVGPFLFVAFVAVGYSYGELWMQRWLPEPGVYRGIFATSLLFAAIHAGAWPTPIPIFVLSMILGVLAYRTGSLLGPITLHALFNMTSMIVKFLPLSAS